MSFVLCNKGPGVTNKHGISRWDRRVRGTSLTASFSRSGRGRVCLTCCPPGALTSGPCPSFSVGITGQTVTVKPYSLSPGETYVLQAVVGRWHLGLAGS